MSRPLTGLYDPEPRATVLADLAARSRRRLEELPAPARDEILEDALYHERIRLERHGGEPEEEARLDTLARALVRGTDAERLDAGVALVHAWADEIHGRFSRRAYRFAKEVMPPAVAALLSARPDRLRDWNLDVEDRVKIEGDVAWLRELAEESTLVLAPTHVSNLDSPLIGLALVLAGLPPFQYGAGLNLFSNPLLGWWLLRLGAYTVDRRKRARLYKDVLTDYSVRQLTRRNHSLFFPGGTRSRSGAIEAHVKKGLLGTGVVAWQEMLEAGRADADVYVVPLTLSFSLTLEAATLIDDHLADAGRQRYIISDDEFAQPRTVATFARRMMNLDDPIVCHFGEPVDVLGRPVPRDSVAREEASRARRHYVCDRDGRVLRDPQRDRIYTERLADALVDAWPRGSTVMATHLAAWAAWRVLSRRDGHEDPFRLVRTPSAVRRLPRQEVLAELGLGLDAVRAGAEAGRWQVDLPDDPAGVLGRAVRTFAAYHRTHALVSNGAEVIVEDPRLCLYYRNRVASLALEV